MNMHIITTNKKGYQRVQLVSLISDSYNRVILYNEIVKMLNQTNLVNSAITTFAKLKKVKAQL